jgi:hypothetical protein
MQRPSPWLLVFTLPVCACGDSGQSSADSTTVTTQPTSLPTGVTEDPSTSPPTPTEGTASATATETQGSATESASGTTETTVDPATSAPSTEPDTTDGTTGTKFDVGDTEGPDTDTSTGAPVDMCKVQDDMDAIGECDKEAPPDSFEPEIQWSWVGPNGEQFSIVTPLVANLTDDNADGAIDLCDIPDVVVVASTSSGQPSVVGHIYVLDGATGTLHFQVPTAVDHTVTPALGDVDNDGLPEIVASVIGGNPVVFEHDGTLKWTSPSNWPEQYSGAIALADADNDGDVEILAGNRLYDHLGTLLFTAPQPAGNWSASAFADLDGDGDQEIVLGHAAYHHTGAQHYVTAVAPGYPSIANLDDDPQPEVLVTTRAGASILEHDGSVAILNATPSGDGYPAWFRPASIHDLDGDNVSELALSAASHYSVVERDMTVIWTAPVQDGSGWSAGTAFDFLGDGIAEAMYTDEISLYVFDGDGAPLLTIPRSSPTLIEYPTVADVDNDGSAEILVVSFGAGNPALQVIRDVEDRWIQARRIWNQHTYHVTNVREDGTIPQHEPPSWSLLNTYRTNAQIEGGGLCKPDPRG